MVSFGKIGDKNIAFGFICCNVIFMNKTAAKLQVRIDLDLKEAAEAVFEEIGLDATTAVRLFFTKVAQTRSIPFRLKAEPEFSPEADESIMAAWEESKDPANRIGPFSDVRELIAHLHDETKVEQAVSQ